MSIVWIEESVVLALHEEHLAEHGGPVGVRNRGLLKSALFRPQNLVGYGDPDLSALSPMVLPATILLSTATNAQISR